MFFCLGTATGHAASTDDLMELSGKVHSPILIGSGVTDKNLHNYFHKSQAGIVGSHFKKGGHWANELCEQRIGSFMSKIKELRNI